jgi:hypothetical protein
MKNLSRLLLAPTLAAALLLACTPTNAARRFGGSPYDGTCGDLHFARGLRFSARSRTDRRRPRVFPGPKLPSEWRCRR